MFIADFLDQPAPILSKDKRIEDSPKKHVTFKPVLEKENDWYSMDMPEGLTSRAIERRLDLEHAHRIMELRARLRRAKSKSDDLNVGIESKYRSHQLIHIR